MNGGAPMNQADKELENYKAQLRRQEQNWHVQFENVLHSDRVAVDIGMMALRTVILMNAGAIVAILAFVGQLWSVDSESMVKVLSGTLLFVWGLVFAASSIAVAYFYQSFVTSLAQRSLAEVSEGSEDLEPFVWKPRFTIITRVLMIFLAVLSIGSFILGIFDVINVIEDLPLLPTVSTSTVPQSS